MLLLRLKPLWLPHPHLLRESKRVLNEIES